MSAPHIPNLNSLRRGGQRGRGRGLGDRTGGTGRKHVDHDQVVRNTDNDAATSRLSAVDAGYLEDPFARLLTPGEGVHRRLPLMNRGKAPPIDLYPIELTVFRDLREDDGN